ncbi:MAG: endolytic transglycosylase MltG [bacterium]|nr:endolytic transglycosylase MltG [bacterium]
MKKIVVIFLGIIAFSILGLCLIYNMNLKAVDKKDLSKTEFMVDSGSTYYNVISKLKKEDLIKSELCFKLYVKFNKVNNVEAGTYLLSKSMSVKDIIDTFSKGNTYNPDAVVITFKEGKNIRSVASLIAKNTSNSENDVYNLLKDKDYLNTLKSKYWFIDDSILNDKIYYSLEGYLYPNTYEFKNKDVTIKEIFETMLDETEKKLADYKSDVLNSKYSLHQILTLASIVELEGGNSSDREGIAGVFYNRLNNNIPLGSDVTTYYASRIDLNERDLYQTEIDDVNDYNTRSSSMAGRLPIGPICNPSIDSIKAVLYPTESDYFYFIADKTGKTYFSKTYSEHKQAKQDLIEAGLWYNYE